MICGCLLDRRIGFPVIKRGTYVKVVGRYGEGLLDAVPSEVRRLERLGYDVMTTGEL